MIVEDVLNGSSRQNCLVATHIYPSLALYELCHIFRQCAHVKALRASLLSQRPLHKRHNISRCLGDDIVLSSRKALLHRLRNRDQPNVRPLHRGGFLCLYASFRAGDIRALPGLIHLFRNPLKGGLGIRVQARGAGAFLFHGNCPYVCPIQLTQFIVRQRLSSLHFLLGLHRQLIRLGGRVAVKPLADKSVDVLHRQLHTAELFAA